MRLRLRRLRQRALRGLSEALSAAGPKIPAHSEAPLQAPYPRARPYSCPRPGAGYRQAAS